MATTPWLHAQRLVIIFSEILRICDNQSRLATVLSHEMAHVVVGHIAEADAVRNMLWYAAIPTLPLVVPSVVIGGGSLLATSFLGTEIAMLALLFIPGMAIGAGLKGAYFYMSRLHESEAGKIGLRIMAKSGFGMF